MAFVFGLQTLSLIEFTKIYRLKGLKPKNKGRTNFYECCDLTKKYIYYTLPGLEYEKSLISEIKFSFLNFFLKEHLVMPSEEKIFI